MTADPEQVRAAEGGPGGPQPPACAPLPNESARAAEEAWWRREPPRAPQALRVALAVHLRSSAGDHLDLFIGPDACADPDLRAARTYRLPLAALEAGSLREGTHEAVELEPHRAEYLRLEAARELSRGRGRVEPIFSRRAVGAIAEDGFTLRLAEAGTPLELLGARARDARWTITASRA